MKDNPFAIDFENGNATDSECMMFQPEPGSRIDTPDWEQFDEFGGFNQKRGKGRPKDENVFPAIPLEESPMEIDRQAQLAEYIERGYAFDEGLRKQEKGVRDNWDNRSNDETIDTSVKVTQNDILELLESCTRQKR